MKIRVLMILMLSLSLTFSGGLALSADNRTDSRALQIKKQPEIQQIKPRKPVKIKLKRLAEGRYTWDLTGDDVDQIVAADKRLKKLLNQE